MVLVQEQKAKYEGLTQWLDMALVELRQVEREMKNFYDEYKVWLPFGVKI